MIESITSLQNKLIKTVASLKQKKYRDELGLFIVEGIRLSEEALHSDWDIIYCVYDETVQSERLLAIVDALLGRDCKVVKASPAIYDKLTETKDSQGILVVVRRKVKSINQVMTAQNPVLVVLDSVQDPGNVGTVIRTADAAGCSAVLLTKGCADLFGGKTVRATMGSLFHLPCVSGLTKQELLECFKQHNIAAFATSLTASKEYFSVNFKQPIAIIFGNEGSGVSEEFLGGAEDRIHIPIYGQAESLNVAASAAVILYETVRQREEK
ncbi:MAG: RNA methyltransferase [Pelosinus sp.]|nr:RNA methyltransferase [Pelosinus sp.]